MIKHDKEEYYHLIHDIKRIELLKKAGFLADKITIEKAVSVILRVMLNLLNDYFSKLNDKYNINNDEYYQFLEEFKSQVNIVLKESNFDDIGIMTDVKNETKICRRRNKNTK